MKFEVLATDGRAVHVDAVDWMMAMASAMPLLGIEVSGWMCMNQPDGKVQVMDPMTAETWLVYRVSTDAPAPPRVAAPNKNAPPPAWEAPAPEGEAVLAEAGAPPSRQPTPITDSAPPKRLPRVAPKSEPSLPPGPPRPPPVGNVTAMWSRPMASNRPPEEKPEPPPEDLAETLFDLSTDIYSAPNGNAACRTALDLVMKLIPCEAGSVLRGTRDDGYLSFVACNGPAANKLVGKKMYFGQGVVGACFDLGITIQVADVSQDQRHNAKFDQDTGFKTKALICAPVRQGGAVFGAMELINPEKRFQPWHVEVMETVSRQLAGLLAVSR
jgi:hypothetical protein